MNRLKNLSSMQLNVFYDFVSEDRTSLVSPKLQFSHVINKNDIHMILVRDLLQFTVFGLSTWTN